MEGYSAFKNYSFTIPEEAQGRTQRPGHPWPFCALPNSSGVGKAVAGCPVPPPRWDYGISADKPVPSETAGSSRADGQGPGMEEAPCPAFPCC